MQISATSLEAKHPKHKFAGIVLVSDNESWVGTGRHGSTGVMTAWEAFVANQRKLAGKEAKPKLVCIDLQPYQTVQACERADIMNIGGFSDSVFNVISAFLADAGILGMLMNTRGLMELIVLNIGLDLGVISPTLFAMMVIMALVTTITTAPALQLLSPQVSTQHGH